MKDIPKRILKDLKFITVEHMDEVLKNALKVDDPESLFHRKPEASIGAETPAPGHPYKTPEVPAGKTRLPPDLLTH